VHHLILGFDVGEDSPDPIAERVELYTALAETLPGILVADLLKTDVYLVGLTPGQHRKQGEAAATVLHLWDQQHAGRLRWFVQIVAPDYRKLYAN
jgi:hypothetical protein